MAGVTDHGGGVSTALAQVAAEELGIDVTRVRVLELDTSAIPDSGPTVASRAATMGGGAVVEACRTLRGALAEVAGKMLRCPTEELLFRGNRITRACGSGPGVSFKEAAAEAFRQGVSLMAEGWHRAPSISWDEERGRGDPYFAYHFGTQIAEVEVDEETGQVLVLRIVAAHDVGKALNPSLVHGQITGGVVMGMGFGVLEDFTVHGGRPEASNFDGYAIPSSLDAPEVIPLIVESPTQHGPFGAKGTGEPTILPTAPAITNAIYHATGRRVRDLPASLERVLLGRALTKHDRR
jgi:CO/xanthine dehydrogenase Mo-binding subunit